MEKHILHQIDQEIKSTHYQPNTNEMKCITAYQYTPFFHGFTIITFFGYLSHLTIKKSNSIWLKGIGLTGLSIGAIACMAYSRQVAAKRCITCFVDQDEETSQLSKWTKHFLVQYPNKE